MKKAGILILTLILIAAMFSGCRRQTPDTTMTTGNTTTPATTSSAAPTTMPHTTTVIPNITEATPGNDATGGTDMGRGRTAPRY